jgi:hypothetical protein
MLATGQNNSPNILTHRHEEQEISMVAPLESPIITFSRMLLQSITIQFYENCTIVIKQFIVQLIRVQSWPLDISIIYTLKLKREQRKYILLLSSMLELILIIKVAEL